MKKFIISSILIYHIAYGACRCVCMNGSVEAVCDTTYEIRPICPSRICPVVPPSIRPLQTPQIPPIGASSCTQQQIYNEATKKYEWNTVCR